MRGGGGTCLHIRNSLTADVGVLAADRDSPELDDEFRLKKAASRGAAGEVGGGGGGERADPGTRLYLSGPDSSFIQPN